MQSPLVSVILVNWNRCSDILENIALLRQIRQPQLEIIVIDNGSDDGSVERFRKEEDIHLIELKDNLGPAAARNRGIFEAKGRYTLFLDSDAFIRDPNVINDIVNRIDEDPTIGIIGGKILNDFNGKIDQWIYTQPASQYIDQEFETYSFSAAGAIARTDALRKVDGFWEDLFIYNEEVDLSIRLIRNGYRILYSPALTVYHRSSPSGRVAMGKYYYFQIRNWLWIFFRYYPGLQCWYRVILYSLIYMVKGISRLNIIPVFRGIYHGIKGLRYYKRFPDKLCYEEIVRINRLNPRRKIKLKR